MASIFAGDPTWETGDAAIDKQHVQLLEQLERLGLALVEGSEVAETERALLLLGD